MYIHILLSIIICLTILLQGGFFTGSYLFFGAILSLLAMFACKKIPRRLEVVLAGSICALYLLSAMINGGSVDVMARSLQPLTVFIFGFIMLNMNDEKKNNILRVITIFTIIIAAFSLILYSDLLVVKGSTVANRLQFTFQYANVAGIFFAVMAIVMRNQSSKKMMRFMPILEVALFLTRSIGAILSYFIGMSLYIFLQSRNKNGVHVGIKEEVLRLFFSGLFAVIMYCVKIKEQPYYLFVILFGGLFLLCRYSQNIFKTIRRYRIHFILFPMAAVGSVVALFTNRGLQGFQTFVERWIQILDAFRALMKHLIVGLGPGNWEYMKEQWQTAQYDARYIHSSYMQIGVDAGIIAFIGLSVLLILYLKKMKQWDPYLVSAITMILLHSLFDITLSFLSINLILITLFLCNIRIEENVKPHKRAWIIIPMMVCIVIFGYCLWGVSIEQKAKAFYYKGNYTQAVKILEDNSTLLKDSYRNQYILVKSLQAMGQNEKASNLINERYRKHPQMIYLKAQILEQEGHYEEAVYTLLEGVRLAPYENELYYFASYIIKEKLDIEKIEPLKGLYNEAVEQAKTRKNKLTQYLENQKEIKPID